VLSLALQPATRSLPYDSAFVASRQALQPAHALLALSILVVDFWVAGLSSGVEHALYTLHLTASFLWGV